VWKDSVAKIDFKLLKLQATPCVWRPMLSGYLQPPQATGHWYKSPSEARETPLHACKVMHAAVPTPAFGFLPHLHWPSACGGHSALLQEGPLARWLLAMLKRKQLTAWDLVLTSCLWKACLLPQSHNMSCPLNSTYHTIC
jgi:hypothetical protein